MFSDLVIIVTVILTSSLPFLISLSNIDVVHLLRIFFSLRVLLLVIPTTPLFVSA